MRRLVFIVLTVVLMLVWGCGDKGGEAVKKTTENKDEKKEEKKVDPAPTIKMVSHELKALGIKLEAPSDWEFKELAGGMAGRLSGPMSKNNGVSMLPMIAIRQSMVPASLDEAAKSCTTDEAASNIVKKTLENGGYYYQCDRQIANMAITNVTLELPMDDGSGLNCGGGVAGKDTVEIVKAICTSVTKL